ncbi:competence protein ComK [Sinobaca sp. H24]|uniref:competence protein ComK n=1 Tax=Sinobaca sp. H24 TaxID=2923376 RepID=UPI0020795E2A|nr:competence protein ComK [Sinobaca sp. H24]
MLRGEAKAVVREEGGTLYFVKQTPAAIISHACLENGSSLKGRGDAVKHLTGFIDANLFYRRKTSYFCFSNSFPAFSR